jgi:integrase
LAIDIFDEVAGGTEWPKSGLVFSTTGRSSPSGFSKAKRRLDEYTQRATREGVTSEAWRLHDLRRTVATGLQRLGVRFEVTEAVLNHVSGARGGIAGVYQRHDWKEEKEDALNKWSGYIERLVA